MKNITLYYDKKLWIIRISLFAFLPPFIFFDFVAFFNLSIFQSFTTIISFHLLLIYLSLYISKKSYQSIKININENSITYSYDFIVKGKKDILFKDIKEIEIKSGPLQNIFKLSTITLHTHATMSGTRQSGMILRDLKNSDEVYEMLKQIKKVH